MSYAKTVAVAIGLCSLILVVLGFAFVFIEAYRQKATGFGFTGQGVIEFAVASIVLGWLFGTAWYLIRR